MTERTVMFTRKGARYHIDDACPGYQQGIRNAEKRGMSLHAPERVSETTAKEQGKRPCLRCGGTA